MADYAYAYKGPEEHTARALLKGAPISTKVAVEICNYLKGKTTQKALTLLESVLKMEHAIPYKRFTNGVGHRHGPLAAGRYPQKASQAFIDLIKLAEANASQKGLSSELKIIHILAHKASTPYHHGRQSRRKTKSTHVEIVLKEMEEKKVGKKKAAVVQTENAHTHEHAGEHAHDHGHDHTHDHAHAHTHDAVPTPTPAKKKVTVTKKTTKPAKAQDEPSSEAPQ